MIYYLRKALRRKSSLFDEGSWLRIGKMLGNEVLSFYPFVHIQQKLLARDTSVIMWWILKKFWKAGENISFTSSTPAWLDGKLSKRFMGKISARNNSTDFKFPKIYCEKGTFAHIMMQWHFKIIESPFKSMLEIKCNFELSLFGCDIKIKVCRNLNLSFCII